MIDWDKRQRELHKTYYEHGHASAIYIIGQEKEIVERAVKEFAHDIKLNVYMPIENHSVIDNLLKQRGHK